MLVCVCVCRGGVSCGIHKGQNKQEGRKWKYDGRIMQKSQPQYSTSTKQGIQTMNHAGTKNEDSQFTFYVRAARSRLQQKLKKEDDGNARACGLSDYSKSALCEFKYMYK